MTRRLIATGSPFEATAGYSRAVVQGDWCFVAGTTHLLSLASSRSNSKKHVEAAANVDECVKLLRRMAVSWPAAEQARLLLDGLRTDYGLAGTVSVPVSPKRESAALPSEPTGTGQNMYAATPLVPE